MNTSVKKVLLQPASDSLNGPLLEPNYLNLVKNLIVDCEVRLGSLSISISELKELREGQLLPLLQKVDEPVDIVLNNEVIARGDLMSVEDFFAIKITEKVLL